MSDVHPPASAVARVVAAALAEDLEPLGDLSAALLDEGTTAVAHLVSRASGTFAGRRCVEAAFAAVDAAVDVSFSADDGDAVGPGAALAAVEGPLRSILTAERTALNLATHLSGIATLTRRFVDAVAATGSTTRVLDTRKTLPGLRSLQKAAVRAGGGHNHRASLSDGVMLKDNHLAALGIAEAVRRSRARWPGRPVHVECDTADQVAEALAAGADRVMLDNMAPDEVAACVALVAGRCEVEVTGGVTLDTVAAYAAAGPDFVSVGALTHSAPALDLGLDISTRPGAGR